MIATVDGVQGLDLNLNLDRDLQHPQTMIRVATVAVVVAVRGATIAVLMAAPVIVDDSFRGRQKQRLGRQLETNTFRIRTT